MVERRPRIKAVLVADLQKTLWAVVLLSNIVMLFSGTASASEPDARAKMYHQEGIRLFDEGRFLQASEKFRQAYEEKSSWKLFFNIAQSEAAGKRYGLALEAFERYMAEGGDNIPNEKRELVLDEITRLRVLVGIVEVTGPSGSELIIDDTVRAIVPIQGIVRVAAGKHHVQILHDGKMIFDDRLHIASGLTTTVEVASDSASAPDESQVVATSESDSDVPPDSNDAATPEAEMSAVQTADATTDSMASSSGGHPRAKKLQLVAIIAGGVGVVGLGMGAAFFIKGTRDARDAADLDESDPARIDYNDNTLPRNKLLTITSFAVGVVGAGAGVVLFLVGKKLERQKVTFIPAPGGVAFAF